MNILTLVITFTACLFSLLLHPLSLGLVLIIQTLWVCTLTPNLSGMPWYSYILFLVFLGAMLVLFIYVASLASNEYFIFSYKLLQVIILILTLMFIFSYPLPHLCSETGNLQPLSLSDPTTAEMVLSTLYNTTGSQFTCFMAVYLLITLFVVVKIASKKGGPLRLS